MKLLGKMRLMIILKVTKKTELDPFSKTNIFRKNTG